MFPVSPGVGARLAEGTRIGEVTFRRLPIFDEARPEENTPLYRLANRLHVLTRPQALRELLTFEEEGPYIAERLREAERAFCAPGPGPMTRGSSPRGAAGIGWTWPWSPGTYGPSCRREM